MTSNPTISTSERGNSGGNVPSGRSAAPGPASPPYSPSHSFPPSLTHRPVQKSEQEHAPPPSVPSFGVSGFLSRFFGFLINLFWALYGFFASPPSTSSLSRRQTERRQEEGQQQPALPRQVGKEKEEKINAATTAGMDPNRRNQNVSSKENINPKLARGMAALNLRDGVADASTGVLPAAPLTMRAGVTAASGPGVLAPRPVAPPTRSVLPLRPLQPARRVELPLQLQQPQPVRAEVPAESMKMLGHQVPAVQDDDDPVKAAERAMHMSFVREALDMARLALHTNETPVGCVLVYKSRVIAKGMNATNVSRNGTRHAEYMALSALLALPPDSPGPVRPPSSSSSALSTSRSRRGNYGRSRHRHRNDYDAYHDNQAAWDEVDPSNGHLYPYGQKMHPAPSVDKSIVKDSVLYVTVEPCVMCAAMLRQLGIKKVYFGAVNDKFGGTGGVFRIHINSPPVPNPPTPTRRVMDGRVDRVALSEEEAGAALILPEREEKKPLEREQKQPTVAPAAASFVGAGSMLPDYSSPSFNTDATAAKPAFATVATPGDYALHSRVKWVIVEAPMSEDGSTSTSKSTDGDGGNVEDGYDAEGGWGRDEAVTLLRQFYVQENGRAPVPRKKEGRAARLAAMMERDGMTPMLHMPALPATAPATPFEDCGGELPLPMCKEDVETPMSDVV